MPPLSSPVRCAGCYDRRASPIGLCDECDCALYPDRRDRDRMIAIDDRGAKYLQLAITNAIGAGMCALIALAGLSAVMLDARTLAAIDGTIARMIAIVIG